MLQKIAKIKLPHQIKFSIIKHVFLWIIVFGFGVQLWASAPDPSQDLLASARADVISNFGPTSTLAYIVYLIEVIKIKTLDLVNKVINIQGGEYLSKYHIVIIACIKATGFTGITRDYFADKAGN